MSKLNNLSKSEIKDLLNVTVCYIVKNEEKYIKKSIDKVKELLNPLEILVVDTGSTDRTVEIALKSGARVEHYEWVHDYSKARNFALKMAKNDMILFLDADEIPYQADLGKIKRGIATYPQAIGRITRQNYCYSSDDKKSIVTDKTERLFDRRIYKYEDAVHEQVVKRNKGKMEAYLLPLVVKHYGYLQSREKLVEKAEYYNSILFRELKKKPNDPYILFQLGQSYRMIGDNKKALEYFIKSLQNNPNTHAEYYLILIQNILILNGGVK
jgi:glycosyltransferase involved in cell wall biosynthesis